MTTLLSATAAPEMMPGSPFAIHDPRDGSLVGTVTAATEDEVEAALTAARAAAPRCLSR